MATAKKQDTLLPVYLVVGEDALKRQTVMSRLRTRLEKMGDLSFNSDEFEGGNATGATIVTACNTMPFLSSIRLVVVRGADKFKKADADAVADYLASPNPTTLLVLVAEKLAKNTRLYKAVEKISATAIIDCAPLKRRELPKTVRSMAVGHGITLTPGAAEKLVELVGEDTVRLDSELKKVSLAHRGSDPVNEHEIMGLVARTAEVAPWEFIDAFSARDARKCLLYYTRMPSVSPFELMAKCTTRVRDLICAHALVERGEAHRIADTLKQQAWRCKNYATWARGFTAEELRHALISARDTEQAMKSGADAKTAFMDWVLDTISRN